MGQLDLLAWSSLDMTMHVTMREKQRSTGNFVKIAIIHASSIVHK